MGSGAYGSPAPAYYVIENQDGLGASPGVDAALIVAGATDNVELSLDTPLVAGALYRLRAIGVAAQAGPASTSASDTLFRFGSPQVQYNAEPKVSNADLLLFARDVAFSGSDYLVTPEEDLATVGGATNAMGALRRRCLGSPLAWAPDYSARAYDSVDAPIAGAAPLRARLQTQGLRDPRFRTIKVVVSENADNQAEAAFVVTPTLVSGSSPGAVKVPISVQS